jgi:hypothetical protein
MAVKFIVKAHTIIKVDEEEKAASIIRAQMRRLNKAKRTTERAAARKLKKEQREAYDWASLDLGD